MQKSYMKKRRARRKTDSVSAPAKSAGTNRKREPGHTKNSNNNTPPANCFSRAIKGTKRLAAEYSPPSFCCESLDTSLKQLTQFIETQYGLVISLSVSDGVRFMGQGESIFILVAQLVRELLANTVKHAQTKKAFLTVTRDKKCIFVEVFDKGVGFTPEEIKRVAKRRPKSGLSIIEEKLESFGGKMKIESKQGKGTRICMALPYVQNAK